MSAARTDSGPGAAPGEHLFGALEADWPVRKLPPYRGDALLTVLASSSSGNCSVLIHDRGPMRRATLIDAGLSPRRTNRALALFGLSIDRVDDVVVTHLDADHFHPGWLKALPSHARLHLHSRHVTRARRCGIDVERISRFDGPFRVAKCVDAEPTLLEHDEWGVAAFRFTFEARDGVATLGYATDVGRVTGELVRHLRGVDVLAIESNYCPVMQARSERPDFLKARITGGSGHLSNEQCREAVASIAPKSHVVLLHLSRECNTPEKAASHHEAAPYRVTVASHDRATRPLRITKGPSQVDAGPARKRA